LFSYNAIRGIFRLGLYKGVKTIEIMNKDCVVVFPVYRTLDEDEIMVLNQAVKMTPGFDKIFVTSQSFQFDTSFDDFKGIKTERFDDRLFLNIQGYNELMLTTEFYKRFADFKYILIHQTDAYLFKDELQYWCDKDYDYIGAPWYAPRKLRKFNLYKFLYKYGKFFYSKETLLRRRHFNIVGNGGLSLRKVDSFIGVLERAEPKLLDLYLNGKSNFYNEDIFWSIEAPEVIKGFVIPKWEEAIYFSLENHPLQPYYLMKKTLPFGCHAFKSDSLDFWCRFIPFKIWPEF